MTTPQLICACLYLIVGLAVYFGVDHQSRDGDWKVFDKLASASALFDPLFLVFLFSGPYG
jgi:hypothetical protein